MVWKVIQNKTKCLFHLPNRNKMLTIPSERNSYAVKRKKMCRGFMQIVNMLYMYLPTVSRTNNNNTNIWKLYSRNDFNKIFRAAWEKTLRKEYLFSFLCWNSAINYYFFSIYRHLFNLLVQILCHWKIEKKFKKLFKWKRNKGGTFSFIFKNYIALCDWRKKKNYAENGCQVFVFQ